MGLCKWADLAGHHECHSSPTAAASNLTLPPGEHAAAPASAAQWLPCNCVSYYSLLAILQQRLAGSTSPLT